MLEAGYEQTHLSFVTSHCRVTLPDSSSSSLKDFHLLFTCLNWACFTLEGASFLGHITSREISRNTSPTDYIFNQGKGGFRINLLPRNRVVTKRCVSFGPLANWVSIKTDFSCPRRKKRKSHHMSDNGPVGTCYVSVVGLRRKKLTVHLYYLIVILLLWLGWQCKAHCVPWVAHSDLSVVLFMAQKKGLIGNSRCHRVYNFHFCLFVLFCFVYFRTFSMND